MTQAERQAQLEHLLLNLLLNLLPADGSNAANGPLPAMWALHAASTGLATSPDDFATCVNPWWRVAWWSSARAEAARPHSLPQRHRHRAANPSSWRAARRPPTVPRPAAIRRPRPRNLPPNPSPAPSMRAVRLDQFHGTVSLPFEAGKHGKAAVKIVDDRGIGSLKILPLKG